MIYIVNINLISYILYLTRLPDPVATSMCIYLISGHGWSVISAYLELLQSKANQVVLCGNVAYTSREQSGLERGLGGIHLMERRVSTTWWGRGASCQHPCSCGRLPGVGQIDRQQLAAGHPEWRVALGVIDDLQEEFAVVIVNLLGSQRAVVIHRQQVPAIHLENPHNHNVVLRWQWPCVSHSKLWHCVIVSQITASFRKKRMSNPVFSRSPPPSLWMFYTALNSNHVLCKVPVESHFDVTMNAHTLIVLCLGAWCISYTTSLIITLTQRRVLT